MRRYADVLFYPVYLIPRFGLVNQNWSGLFSKRIDQMGGKSERKFWKSVESAKPQAGEWGD